MFNILRSWYRFFCLYPQFCKQHWGLLKLNHFVASERKNYYTTAILFSSIFIGGCSLHKDFAGTESKNAWSHHFAFGSPSWDSFERLPNNPVFEGREGMEWPVNGFLFNDPVSKNWYLYIGEYRRNYAIVSDSASKNFNCVIYKSADRGKSWGKMGDLFPLNMHCYDSLKIQAPDVMVVYDSGKYHLIFDWISGNSTWTKMGQSGIGYAVADHPEGPYKVSAKPLKINTQYQDAPLLKKYWRMYAPMLVKRQNDWVMLYIMDTAPPRSWALTASTAANPEGPYSEPVLIKNVEGMGNYPPLMEYFPAFNHDGYTYFPATSVAVNRNYQLINRVKTEAITEPKKWEVFSAGSFWHSTPEPNEYAGIWGQTITGFVDDSDSIVMMYPSKTKQNYGTINLAKSSWSHLFRKCGFNLSACEGGSFTWIKKGIDPDQLKLDFTLTGTMHLVWDFHKPLEIKDTWGNHSFDQQEGDYKEIEISQNHWKVRYINRPNIQVIDSGVVRNLNKTVNRLELNKRNGIFTLSVNGQQGWTGSLPDNPGVVGIILDPHSNLTMNHFYLTGRQIPGKLLLGSYEALLNAGNQDKDWDFLKDPIFRMGHGTVSKQLSATAKWNFEGTGFKLWMPHGSEFGSVSVFVDGRMLGNVNLRSDQFLNSSVVFQLKSLPMGPHAVYITSTDGKLPVDCLEVTF